jgi:hypothetical protein
MSNIGIEKRDIDLIDWRKVSTNLVTGLEKEQQRRDTLKKEIDDNTRSLEDAITRTPVGNNDKVNGWVMNYSANATEGLLAMHRGLKNGTIRPKDYSTFMANAKSSTSQIFDSIKAFNDEAKIVNERIQQGIASNQQAQVMALVEGFADLDKSTPIFQSDGTVQIVKLKDGKPVDGADGRVTVNQLMGLIGTRIDKYDLDASSAAAVKQVGSFVSEILETKGGKDALAILAKTKDASQLQAIGPDGQRVGKQWLKTEQLLADQMLASPWNIASVLSDHSGGQYQITLDSEKAASDKNYILYSYEGGKLQPNFTTDNGKKQKSIAEGLVKDKIRSQIDQEITKQAVRPQVEEKTPPRPEQQWEYEARVGKQNLTRQANLLGYLYSGTPEQIKSATDYFAGLPNISRIVRKTDGVEVYNKAGEKNFVSFTGEDGKPKTQADFIRSLSSSTGVSGDLASLPDQSLGTGKKLNTTYSKDIESKKETPPSSLEALTQGISKKLDSSMPPSVGTNDATEKETASALGPLLSASGLSMKKAGWKTPLSQIVTIYKGKDALGEINLKDANAVDQIKAIMLKNIPDPTKDPVGFKQASSYFVAPRI